MQTNGKTVQFEREDENRSKNYGKRTQTLTQVKECFKKGSEQIRLEQKGNKNWKIQKKQDK